MGELIKEDKFQKIKLADGKEYTFSLINWNVMAYIEEEFDCKFSEFSNYMENVNSEVSIMRKLVFIFLKDNYPDLTIVQLGKLITVENMEAVGDAVGVALLGEGFSDIKKATLKKIKSKRPTEVIGASKTVGE